MSYFPVSLDLREFPALVVGGGSIAYRKIKNLLDFGGDITVIAPQVSDEILRLVDSGDIKLSQREYRSGDSAAFKVVFSATGDKATDNIIWEDCKKENILINTADEPDLCNIIIPSYLKRGSMTISIGTEGNAPFFSKYMRKRLDRMLSPMLEEIIEIAAVFRKRMMECGVYEDENLRNKLIRKFSHENWERIIYKSGTDGAFERLDEFFEEIKKK